jgi:hypothetical protein
MPNRRASASTVSWLNRTRPPLDDTASRQSPRLMMTVVSVIDLALTRPFGEGMTGLLGGRAGSIDSKVSRAAGRPGLVQACRPSTVVCCARSSRSRASIRLAPSTVP